MKTRIKINKLLSLIKLLWKNNQMIIFFLHINHINIVKHCLRHPLHLLLELKNNKVMIHANRIAKTVKAVKQLVDLEPIMIYHSQ